MFYSEDVTELSPQWKKWCQSTSEEEQIKIAEENGWDWYFDWFDTGDILRSKYEKADKNPRVANKYGGYDRLYEEHKTESSYVCLGTDAKFHTTDKPVRQWTVYNDCTNYNCKYNNGKDVKGDHRCSFFYDNARMYDCFNELFASIQAIKDVTGDLSVIKENFNIHKDIIGWFEQGDKYFEQKGDDKMSKPFWTALSELKTEDDISVFWTENTMYVNDENDGQATVNVSLYQAYKFAVLINAVYFDYVASDEEVKQLSEQLLNLIDEDERAVNVWDYIDDIKDDFFKLTGIMLDIDDKRHIVCNMTEMGDGYDLMCGFGSVTYIARTLWNYIKGDEHRLQCKNKTINKLTDEYLQTDNYDLQKFAEELHKSTEELHMSTYNEPTTLDAFIISAYHLTERCYFIGTSLLSEQKDFDLKFMVGTINWQNDWEKPIYCCMNSKTKNIWFEANDVKSAFIYDMALPHLMCGCDFDEIKIRLTHDNVDEIMKEYNLKQEGTINAYIHCNMYGTQGKLQSFV